MITTIKLLDKQTLTVGLQKSDIFSICDYKRLSNGGGDVCFSFARSSFFLLTA